MKKYDVIVIGAGPAGGACASTCAKEGLKVAMVESYGFGGTCPLRGCNPKKVLTGAADIVALARGMTDKGLMADNLSINWEDLAAFRDSFVSGKKEKIQEAYAGLGIDTFNAQAVVLDDYQVQAGEDIMTAQNIVLASGIKPAPINVPGAEYISTSDDFLSLEKLPDSIVFIGGGFISFEFASIAVRAGVKTTIIHRSAQVLKQFDPDLTAELVEAMRDAGVTINLNTDIKSITRDKQKIKIQIMENGKTSTIDAHMVVHGAGRIPDVDKHTLEKYSINVSSAGVEVDEHMRCKNNDRFFAVGDVASTPFALTPTGDMEGRVAASNIIKPGSSAVDYIGTASAVYTAPPLCAVGLLEKQAREAGINLRIVRENMAQWFSWTHLGQKFAGCKILIDEDMDVIVGAHILGAGAEEMSNLFAMAIRMQIPVKELKKVLWAYPTKGYYFKYMI